MLKKLFYIPVKNLLYWLIALQVLDGVFTYLGLRMLGLEAEGNPLLKSLILEYGFIALIVAKLVAISFVLLLGRYAKDLITAYTVVLFFGAAAYYYVVFKWALILIYGKLIQVEYARIMPSFYLAQSLDSPESSLFFGGQNKTKYLLSFQIIGRYII